MPIADPQTGLRLELASWPASVRDELERRADAIRGRAFGKVLDLDDPSARDLVRVMADTDSRLPGTAGSPGSPGNAGSMMTFDSVVSVAALAEFADLGAAIRGVDALLGSEGRFFFVEPVARPGWKGLASHTIGSVFPSLRGHHLGRDVPRAIRASPLIITDIERFNMLTSTWPLRPFALGRARRFEVGPS